MKPVPPSPNLPKIIMRRCQCCSVNTDKRFLFKIHDKWACMTCGNKAIAKWNRDVAEVSPDTINTVSPR